MAFLSESHPEVFYAQPRPGGIVKIEEPDNDVVQGTTLKGASRSSKSTIRSSRSTRSSKSKKSIDPNMFNPTFTTVSRDFRIKNVMATAPWVLFADEEEAISSPPNPLQDTIDILAIAITTIMLMAAGHKDVSTDHYAWTLSYLENVRDEFGNIPPNIRGILNHIKMLNPTLESFNEKILLDTSVSLAPSAATDANQAAAEPPAAEEAPAEEAPAEEAPAEEAPAEEAPAEEEAAPEEEAPAEE